MLFATQNVRSLTMVCVASLRDLADAITSDPALFVAKVEVVAIQGGMEHDEETGNWKPDASVNNLFGDSSHVQQPHAHVFLELLVHTLSCADSGACPQMLATAAQTWQLRRLCTAFALSEACA